MKKLIPMVAVAAFAMMFTSCKKDYTCTCTISYNTAGVPATTTTLPITKTTKSKATDACKAAETTYSSTAAGTTASCKL